LHYVTIGQDRLINELTKASEGYLFDVFGSKVALALADKSPNYLDNISTIIAFSKEKLMRQKAGKAGERERPQDHDVPESRQMRIGNEKCL
jgi:hypothetical protein